MAVIFPFGEGKTDGIVFRFLVEKHFSEQGFHKFVPVGGESRFRKKIVNTVEKDLETGRDEVRILVFRDLDYRERINSVCQAFADIVRVLLASWEVRPLKKKVLPGNIYKWEIKPDTKHPGFRLVLHIANTAKLGLPVSLRNQTTDGYVLGLGLTDQVLSRFARENKVRSDADSLRQLVTSNIPDAIRQKGITFDEDKDYLAAYLAATRFWVVKRTEDQARLTRIILDRAWNYNRKQFDQLFGSWKIAIREVLQ